MAGQLDADDGDDAASDSILLRYNVASAIALMTSAHSSEIILLPVQY